ncbi:unnamed protein product [Brachionus calyciflorus]|uniref:DUF6570 domain-containing protein n=1 Tax=Brachionus calyciflorus TaxID=104777 RepID=A0A814NR86_9BILA|nr:unnamed protein product [Brachionus calyciflorus]
MSNHQNFFTPTTRINIPNVTSLAKVSTSSSIVIIRNHEPNILNKTTKRPLAIESEICRQNKRLRSNDSLEMTPPFAVPGIDALDLETKKAFEDLTVVEEILISPILALMSVFRLPGGALTNRGFCANFSQDIQPIVTLLPRLPRYIPLIILKKKDQTNKTRNFIDNKHRVLTCLNFLFKNNPQYIAYNITIDENAIQQLPENSIPDNLREVECPEDDLVLDKGPELNERNENFDVDGDFYNTFVEDEENQILLDDRMKNAINFPQASQNSLNEFQTDALCSLAFPKLLPNDAGDPTRKARIKDVSEALGFKHLMKSVAKSYKNEEFYYAWAKHQKFKFWAYDRLRRHMSLEQCKIFLKHNVHEANLTINDLKNIINKPQ